MKDTIAQMLKIEAEAREMVAKLQAESEKAVSDARIEAANIEEEALRSAQARAARFLENGLAEARAARDAALQEIDQRNESLRHVAQDKAGAAKKIIFSAVTGR
jgi:vacuolar-type H+-ATPase subunit H